MKTFHVDDISKMWESAKEVDAESPIAAVRKCFPDCEISRDYTNTGDIVVRAPYMTRYGKNYRLFVYNREKMQVLHAK